MITIQWPPLELQLMAYILAANLLIVFLGYMSDRFLLKQWLYDYFYLAIIISALFIFISVAIQSENFEIVGIVMVIIVYVAIAFILVLMISHWLITAVNGMRILREYEKGIKEEREFKEE
jgi:hypothetical protein